MGHRQSCPATRRHFELQSAESLERLGDRELHFLSVAFVESIDVDHWRVKICNAVSTQEEEYTTTGNNKERQGEQRTFQNDTDVAATFECNWQPL